MMNKDIGQLKDSDVFNSFQAQNIYVERVKREIIYTLKECGVLYDSLGTSFLDKMDPETFNELAKKHSRGEKIEREWFQRFEEGLERYIDTKEELQTRIERMKASTDTAELIKCCEDISPDKLSIKNFMKYYQILLYSEIDGEEKSLKEILRMCQALNNGHPIHIEKMNALIREARPEGPEKGYPCIHSN